MQNRLLGQMGPDRLSGGREKGKGGGDKTKKEGGRAR